MRFSEYISVDTILPNLTAKNKVDAIHEMAEVLRKNSLTEIDGDYLWLPQERRWATEEEHRDWLRKQNTIRGNELEGNIS